jgi:MATE family multidrug resistance protein
MTYLDQNEVDVHLLGVRGKSATPDSSEKTRLQQYASTTSSSSEQDYEMGACDERREIAVETTCLISKSGQSDISEAARPQHLWDEVFQEFKILLALAIPITGTYLLEMLPGITSIILVGHLGQEQQRQLYIDAASMATVFINLTGMSTGIGLASAMDTLCSQAYGAGEAARMGVYLQTGIIVLSAAYVVVFLVNYYCEEILLALGQPEEVAQMAGTYAKYVLPGLPFIYLYELLRKMLQAQNITMPMLYVALVANIVNVALGYYLVFFTSWGFLGAAVSRTVASGVQPLFLFLYMCKIGGFRTVWRGWRLNEALAGVKEFLELGVAGMMQLCFEWWAFEILYIFCGWLPDATIAIGANAIFMNVSSMCYMAYLGMSISVNVRIGNVLGAGDQHLAAISSRVAFAMSGAISILMAASLICFRHYLPLLFTPDPSIDAAAESMAFVAAALQLPDALNSVVQGVFRGSGRQNLGACLNFAAYYLLGIPFGAFLAFSFHQGLSGLWIGLTCALFTISCVGVFIIERSDWASLAQVSQDRVKSKDPEKEESVSTFNV